MRIPIFTTLAASTFALTLTSAEPTTYFKGNTHAHSLWSDGNDFPEMVVDYYHRQGYDFATLSDHDTLAEGYKWMSLQEIEKRQQVAGIGALEKYRARFGDEWITWKTVKGEPGVVLKTLESFRRQFEVPGKFLILKAEEISNLSESGPVHMNALNLEHLIPPVKDETRSTVDIMREILRAAARQEEALGQPILTHLNHPNFRWAVTAEDLAAVVEEQFFEVFNGHPGTNQLGSDAAPSVEMIWDIANTIRIARLHEAPLFGVATDDSHYYHGGTVSPGKGWIMVAATELTSNALIHAMRAGEFYASSGVSLHTVRYDHATRVIEIEINPGTDTEATFVGELIGTRVDHDFSATTGKGRVGEVLATQQGRKLRFEVPSDALYARVTITSSQAHENPSWDGQTKQAWTQPVGWR